MHYVLQSAIDCLIGVVLECESSQFSASALKVTQEEAEELVGLMMGTLKLGVTINERELKRHLEDIRSINEVEAKVVEP